tara:strand:- start:1438 stop:1869 length:432 start_codon:yes stop_codon:yes gene_type:complete
MWYSICLNRSDDTEYWGAFDDDFSPAIIQIVPQYESFQINDEMLVALNSMREGTCIAVFLSEFSPEAVNRLVLAVLKAGEAIRTDKDAEIWVPDEFKGRAKTILSQFIGYLEKWGLISEEMHSGFNIDDLIAMETDGDPVTEW